MATKDFSSVPVVVTITNVSEKAVAVPFYRTPHQVCELAAGDVLKLKAHVSSELAFYDALAGEELTVEFGEASA